MIETERNRDGISCKNKWCNGNLYEISRSKFLEKKMQCSVCKSIFVVYPNGTFYEPVGSHPVKQPAIGGGIVDVEHLYFGDTIYYIYPGSNEHTINDIAEKIIKLVNEK